MKLLELCNAVPFLRSTDLGALQIFLAHAMTCILAIFMAIFCMHEIRPKKPFSGHIAGFFIDALEILRLSYLRKFTLVLVKKTYNRKGKYNYRLDQVFLQ